MKPPHEAGAEPGSGRALVSLRTVECCARIPTCGSWGAIPHVSTQTVTGESVMLAYRECQPNPEEFWRQR